MQFDFRQNSARRLMLTVTCCAVFSGCTPAPGTPDQEELSTFYPSHAIPKSSPSQFVSTFEKVCLTRDSSLAAFDKRLRHLDYLPVGMVKDGRRSYVVDDNRPLVMLKQESGKTYCSVAAIARTGQAQRVRDMVAENFPQAQPIDLSRADSTIEAAWRVMPDSQDIIVTFRNKTLGKPSTFLLVFTRHH